MSVTRKCVSEGRCGRIRAWLCGTDRRPEKNSTFRPGLERLERRDVPSATGLDPAQIQAGLHYLGQVVQQQTDVLQRDMRVLLQDVQQGQNGRIVADVQRLQQDIRVEPQAILNAIDAVLSGHIPSAVPAAVPDQVHKTAPVAQQGKTGAAATNHTIETSVGDTSSSSTASKWASTLNTTSRPNSSRQSGTDLTDTELLDLLFLGSLSGYSNSYDPYASFSSGSVNWGAYQAGAGVAASGSLFDSDAGNLFGDSPISDGFDGPGSDDF